MWVAGHLLGLADALVAGTVVLVLDLPADDLPWLALDPAGEWVGDQLRLGKRSAPVVLPATDLAGVER